MRYRSIWILPIFLILLSCNSVTGVNSEKHELVESNPEQVMSYEIADMSYSNKEITIIYPTIVNFEDNNIQNKVNGLMKDEAMKMLDVYADEESNVTMEINYQVTNKSDHLLSVQFVGYSHFVDGSYPINIFNTVNVNVTDGDKIKLNDVISIDDAFVQEFKNGEYRTFTDELNLEDEGVIADLVNSFSNDDLLNYFIKADEIGEENSSGTYSYFTQDSIGISITVPHALGDHFEMEIKYKDIVAHMKNIDVLN